MIYIAGPFFNKEERDYLNYMIHWVKQTFNDELFIPMDHFIENGENISNEEWGKAVFNMDVEALSKSNLIIALYLGHYSDTGTAWELGYAYAKNIPIILFIPEECSEIDMSIMPINCAKIINGKFNNQK